MVVVQDVSSPVDVTYSVNEVTKGVASLKYLVLAFDGVPAAPIEPPATALDVSYTAPSSVTISWIAMSKINVGGTRSGLSESSLYFILVYLPVGYVQCDIASLSA